MRAATSSSFASDLMALATKLLLRPVLAFYLQTSGLSEGLASSAFQMKLDPLLQRITYIVRCNRVGPASAT